MPVHNPLLSFGFPDSTPRSRHPSACRAAVGYFGPTALENYRAPEMEE